MKKLTVYVYSTIRLLSDPLIFRFLDVKLKTMSSERGILILCVLFHHLTNEKLLATRSMSSSSAEVVCLSEASISYP